MRDSRAPRPRRMVLACAGARAAAQPPLTAVRVPGAAARSSIPTAPVWKRTRGPVKVAMLPQTVALPNKPDPAVKELTVRAVHNGGWIAFLIEWKDPTQSDRIVLDNFGDQVAVELPIDTKATAAVAHDGQPGRTGDHHAVARRLPARPRRRPADDPRPLSERLGRRLPGRGAGRDRRAAVHGRARRRESRSRAGGASPVLDQMAEGWGSMTVKPDQHALGKGVWKDGTWRVVITRPLVSDDVNAPRLLPGDRTVVRLRGVGGRQPRGRRAQGLVALGAAGGRSDERRRRPRPRSGRCSSARRRRLPAAGRRPSPAPGRAPRASSPRRRPRAAPRRPRWRRRSTRLRRARPRGGPLALAQEYVFLFDRGARCPPYEGAWGDAPQLGGQGGAAGRHRRLLRGVRARRPAERPARRRGPHRGRVRVHERASS